MTGFLIGLAVGVLIGIDDLGEPVPYQTITYTDSSRVIKVYNTSAFKYRYMPNTYAFEYNTHDFRYFDTNMTKPIYVKTVHANPKPKPKPKPKNE